VPLELVGDHKPLKQRDSFWMMLKMGYGNWRDYNPGEAVRFYALRLREAGMIKGSPQKLIAQGTDWRIWNELKRELKA
jgi:NitT/TauT family transport system substrate-binding protein